MASQAKFLDFIDMIDGGGAGRMGDTFQGGGIFSALANLLATPYGSEDEGRRASREAFLRSRGLLDEPAVAAAQSAAAPAPAARVVRPRVRPAIPGSDYPDMSMPANSAYMSPLEPFGGAGPNITGAAAERGMGLDPFGGAGMNMDYLDPRSQTYDSGFRVPPVSTYGGDINPTQDGRIQAQQNIDNRERMRMAMSQITRAEYDAMSRGQKAELGLPVRGIDLMFAGSDAFKQPMQYSGRGTASGNAGFDRFMSMIRTDPNFSYLMNDPSMAYSVYNRMQQSGTQF